MVVKDEVIGMLWAVWWQEVYQISAEEQSLVEGIVRQAAIAIDSARLFGETERRAEEMSILHEASLELAQKQQDLNTVLETITRRAMDLLDSDGGGVWLWREQRQELELVITFQVGEVEFAGRRLKPGEGLTGRAFTQKTLQVVDDYLTWNGQSDTFHDAPFVSGIAVPMTWQTEVVGVLVATRSEQDHPYTGDEKHLAELLAGQAAAVIQNARLFASTETTATRFALLNTIGRQTAAQRDLDKVLQTTVDALEENLGYFRVAVLFIDEEAQELYLAAATSNFLPIIPPGYRQKVGEGVIGAAAALGETILTNDASAEPRSYAVGGWAPLSSLTIPIRIGGRVVGVLEAEGEEAGAFSQEDAAVLEIAADQLAVAIQNARLFAETEARAEELAVLNEMGRALSARLDVDAALYNVYRYVSRLMDLSNFYVAFYYPEIDGLSFPLVVEDSRQIQWESRRCGKGLIEHVIGTAEPLLIAENVSDYIREQLEGVDHVGRGTQSWLGVPMIVGDSVLGVMAVQSYTTPRVYGEHDLDLLNAIAGQVAIAIQNVRLLEQTQARARREQILREITTRVRASTDPDTIMRTAVRELGTALGRPTFVRLGSAEELSRAAIGDDGADGNGSGPDRSAEGGE